MHLGGKCFDARQTKGDFAGNGWPQVRFGVPIRRGRKRERLRSRHFSGRCCFAAEARQNQPYKLVSLQRFGQEVGVDFVFEAAREIRILVDAGDDDHRNSFSKRCLAQRPAKREAIHRRHEQVGNDDVETISGKQGIRIGFADGSRIVLRLSGTGTVATHDLSPLEPTRQVQSFYARGIGLVAQQTTEVLSVELSLVRVRRH